MIGYTGKGIGEMFNRTQLSNVDDFIKTARLVDGLQDLKACSEPERQDIISRWNVLVAQAEGRAKELKRRKGKKKENRK